MAFIVKQRTKNNGINLYWVTAHWDKKKQSSTQQRKYLGKLSDDGMEIIKNRKITSLSEEQLVSLKKYGIEFHGKECPLSGRKLINKRKTSIPALKEWKSLEYGRVITLKQMAQEAGLINALKLAFSDCYDEILASAIFQCCSGNAIYRCENWLEETIFNEEKLSISNSSIDRMIKNIGVDCEARTVFFREWIKQQNFPSALIHDTTSMSSYAEKINMVEWGYNRDKEKLPQINFALVYGANEQLPLYYRLIPGSIPDVSTLKHTSAMLAEFGLKNFTFALDRGYFSKANLLDLIKNKNGFTIGLPLENKEAIRMLNTNKIEINNIVNGLLIKGLPYGYAKDTFILKDDKNNNKEYALTAHLFLNTQRRDRQKMEFDKLLLQLQNSFAQENFTNKTEALEWCEINLKKLDKLYFLTGRGNKIKLNINQEEYENWIKNFGVFILLNSDKKSTGAKTLSDNKSRDAVEKLFDTLKNAAGADRLKVSSDVKCEGKLFVSFVAIILRSLMEKRLRDNSLLLKMTVNQALDLLKKVRVAISSDGKQTLQEIPKKTRELLKSLELILPIL